MMSSRCVRLRNDFEINPVFIGGCDRSGTTLLGAMLGGSPKAITTPESQFVAELYPGTPGNLGRRDRERIIEKLCRHWRLKIWKIKELESNLKFLIRDNECSYSKIISNIVVSYAKQMGKNTVTTWVDHTPSNLSYAERFLKMFPSAKFIHIVRDGRGVAASFLKLPWGPNTSYAAADFWVSKVGLGIAAEMWLKSERIMRVYFEELLRDPMNVLVKLCEFIGIEYREKMIQGGNFVVPRYTKNQHFLVGERPNPKRIDSWKNDLRLRDIELFEVRSGDLLSYLGYELMFKGAARGPTRREFYWLVTKEWLLRQTNIMRSRFRVMSIRAGYLG